MRILIAGGSGTLGRTLIPLLSAAGHTVIATSRTVPGAQTIHRLGATAAFLDAGNRASVMQTVAQARAETVIHALTDLSEGNSASNASLRITGTRNLVDAALAAGTSRLVAGSISWAYPAGTNPATETEPLDLAAPEPRRTTIAGVAALESAAREVPHHTVLRFGQFYGPDTWYARDGKFGRAAQQGQFVVPGGVTSFIHITDAARAILASLNWEPGTWNIVDTDPAPPNEWGPHFAAAVGGIRPDPAAVHTNIGRPVSSARARSTGFALQYPSWRTGFLSL